MPVYAEKDGYQRVRVWHLGRKYDRAVRCTREEALVAEARLRQELESRYPTPTPEQALLLKLKSMSDRRGECWFWLGNVDEYGYGRVGGRKRRAHRVWFELVRGPIPAGMDLDHLCRNRRCVRPDHLEIVTRQENIRRGVAARKARGPSEGPSEKSAGSGQARNAKPPEP